MSERGWFVVDARYPDSEPARRRGCGADHETSSVAEAYGKRRRMPVPHEGRLD